MPETFEKGTALLWSRVVEELSDVRIRVVGTGLALVRLDVLVLSGDWLVDGIDWVA